MLRYSLFVREDIHHRRGYYFHFMLLYLIKCEQVRKYLHFFVTICKKMIFFIANEKFLNVTVAVIWVDSLFIGNLIVFILICYTKGNKE